MEITQVNSITKTIVQNKRIRSRLMFFLSTITSIGFILFNSAIAMIYHSFWYGSLAIYYLWIVALKLFILGYNRIIHKNRDANPVGIQHKECKIYRATGFLLILVEITRTATVLQMTTMKNPVERGVLLASIFAYYTVFRVIVAIINLVKSKKSHDMILRAISSISFVEAMNAILALSSSMVSTYGNFENMRYLLQNHAIAISMVTLFMALFIIVDGTKRMHNI